MSTTTSIPVHDTPKQAASSRGRTRYLYSAFALILLVLMLIGFQQFFLHGRAFPNRPITPPIRNLVILHGVATTLWLLLAVVQPLLISQRLHKLHMKLGMIGTGLAALVTVSGLKVAVEWGRVAPPDAQLWELPFKNFMTIPFCIMLVFGTYVTIGVLNRKRPEIHRPMMFLGTLFLMPAPIDRINAIVGLYQTNILGTIFGAFFPIFFIGGAFLVVKWLLTRSWDRHFAVAWAIIVVLGIGIMQLARSPASETLANLLFSI